ncbi:MAG TPA: hypothetical protein VFD08_01650, partial [Clostridia bacterium]|nr:hypothetical protein [Clostridia bacterium]
EELLTSFLALEQAKKSLEEEKLPLERKVLRHKRQKAELEEDKKLFEEKMSFLQTKKAETASQISALAKNISLYRKWQEEGDKNLEEARKLLGGEILYKKIRPKKGYEKALEAALAQGLNSLDLRGVPSSTWMKKLGRSSVNLIYQELSPLKARDEKSLGSLENFVEGPRDLCENLLGGILVYPSLEEALEGPKDLIRVTLKGERLEKGFYYGSENAASPLEISIKLEEGLAEKEELQAALEEVQKEIYETTHFGREKQKELKDLLLAEEILAKEQKSLKDKENLLYSEERLSKFKKEQSQEAITRQKARLEELVAKHKDLKAQIKNLKKEEENVKEMEGTSELESLDELRQKSLTLRLEEARSLEEVKRWEEEIYQLELGRQENKKRQEEKKEKKDNSIKENRQLLAELDSLREIYAREQSEIKRLDEQAFSIKKEIDLVRNKLPELEKTRSLLEEELYLLHDEQSKKEIRLSRVEERKNALSEEIWRKYELSMLQIKDLDLSCEEPRSYRKKIRQEMLELEPVNLKAPEEFEEVDERHGFLSVQLADIAASKKDLETTIDSLEVRMVEEFTLTFSAIRENFKDIFSHLFRGGQGDILLEDPEDVLASDILILASPPGKKLQHMNLLSGGEKSLTAIALLFAVLKTKPAPFYVLDEIEAALDDINIQRFGTFLEEFSEGSQFILITHRKGTMEFADALYGVSMEEKGISSLVSLKMEES